MEPEEATMRTHTMIDSPIGVLTLVNADDVLCGLHMEYRQHPPVPSSFGEETDVGFEQISEELGEYFAGERTEFTVPLAPHGTEFQRRVWDALLTIPYGETRSYGEIARQIGEPGWEAARAVGAANGRNPISIVVPCHRVIGADGSLVGYGGGLDRKKFLLGLENRAHVVQESLFA
jgi:methylated-DNA-[protein]-cysteine S-methyltransferase